MFGDDSFMGIDDLFNQLARGRSYSSRNHQSQQQNLLNTIESKKETILIFDLSGKKISFVEIRDDVETNEYGERVHSGKKVLAIGLESNDILKYSISTNLARRKLDYTFVNGILEVSFKK